MDGVVDVGPELVIEMIPAEHIGHLYPKIEDLITALPGRSSGAWTLDGILRKLAEGDWQLWVVHDQGVIPEIKAIVGTELWRQMSGRLMCSIHFCTGHDRKQWIHLLKVIEDRARESGAERIEIVARQGWAKLLPDYEKTHIVLERAL